MRQLLFAVLCGGGLLFTGCQSADAAPPLPALAKPSNGPFCEGEYAEDFNAMSPVARAFESSPQQKFTYCVRSSAVYECPSYAADGSLRKTQKKTRAHGTAFAYQQANGETLLLTNQHVAEWPAVTDADHPVDEVPSGCKRVSDRLRIVDGESDEYERDDVALSKVVGDPQLDIAVLKAKATLPVMPWKIGRSSALKERDVVDVRGFPLGAFKANNVGKVVSAYDHDDDKDWDHDDFVIDALLSPGNSGSPVMALSCKTGELELVGVYHAGYTRGSALNVVVGIDQVRDLMTTLKRSPHPQHDPDALDLPARSSLISSANGVVEPFFPFGPLTAAVRPRSDGALVFEVFTRDFPFQPTPALVLEDLPGQSGFGELGRVFFGNARGLKPFAKSDLDADTQGQLLKVLDALRNDALAAFAYRASAGSANASRERFDQMSKAERSLKRLIGTQQDVAQSGLELAERLAPGVAEQGVSLAVALQPPPPSTTVQPAQLAGGAH
ncbi:MAG: serine protease [Myxococcaceae bacterium]